MGCLDLSRGGELQRRKNCNVPGLRWVGVATTYLLVSRVRVGEIFGFGLRRLPGE